VTARWLTLSVPHTYQPGDHLLLPHFDVDEQLVVAEVDGQRLLVRDHRLLRDGRFHGTDPAHPQQQGCAHPQLWRPFPRCSHCGHRVYGPTGAPVQTRHLPWWWWPMELVSRAEARVMRRSFAADELGVLYSPEGGEHG